jgi:hypothetical protein
VVDSPVPELRDGDNCLSKSKIAISLDEAGTK